MEYDKSAPISYKNIRYIDPIAESEPLVTSNSLSALVVPKASTSIVIAEPSEKISTQVSSPQPSTAASTLSAIRENVLGKNTYDFYFSPDGVVSTMLDITQLWSSRFAAGAAFAGVVYGFGTTAAPLLGACAAGVLAYKTAHVGFDTLKAAVWGS